MPVETKPHDPTRIAVLLLPPVIGYDAVIPAQVFDTANDLAGRELYRVTMVGLDRSPVKSSHGYAIVPEAGPEALPDADIVIIPGTMLRETRHLGVLPPEVTAALAQVRPDATRVSICTGAFVWAAAGVLDGRPATTHWHKVDEFARLYPSVDLDPQVLFIDDGDLLTSAGLSAGVDLCLHLVRRDHGAQLANEVARYLVAPPWREGGQAQFIERPMPAPDDASTAAVRAWVLAHLADDHSVDALARRATMSERTFARRFRHETGQSPGSWLIHQRIREAQHLLEATDLPVDEVARRAGLGSSASLRQHLKRVVGVSPGAYRRTFRGAPASQERG